MCFSAKGLSSYLAALIGQNRLLKAARYEAKTMFFYEVSISDYDQYDITLNISSERQISSEEVMLRKIKKKAPHTFIFGVIRQMVEISEESLKDSCWELMKI